MASRTDTSTADVTAHTDPAVHAEHERHEHPSDAEYIKVAIILAIVTAIEVALYYWELPLFNNYALLALAAAKFVVVVLWFMHLRFDSRLLRRIFVVGVILAVTVYFIALITFSFIEPFS